MRNAAMLFLLSCLAGSGFVQAQPADDEAVHDEIRELRDRLVGAINEQDIDALLAGVHEEVVFTGMDGSVVRGHAGVRDYFERMMVGPDRVVANLGIDVTVDELTVLYGRDAGVAYGSSNDHYELTSGMEFDVIARWSATLVNENGRWQLASFHSSAGIFDNPLLTAATRMMYLITGIAAVAALVVGFLFGRWGSRRAG